MDIDISYVDKCVLVQMCCSILFTGFRLAQLRWMDVVGYHAMFWCLGYGGMVYGVSCTTHDARRAMLDA